MPFYFLPCAVHWPFLCRLKFISIFGASNLLLEYVILTEVFCGILPQIILLEDCICIPTIIVLRSQMQYVLHPSFPCPNIIHSCMVARLIDLRDSFHVLGFVNCNFLLVRYYKRSLINCLVVDSSLITTLIFAYVK